ncbi:MAG TPA: DUF2252 domain-containing protein [Puia sp.]|nr:DUF2252 domain-containing protein [Puia sp.]
MDAANRLVYSSRSIHEPLLSIPERMEHGKQQRVKVPRDAHAAAADPKNRFDPVQLIIDNNAGRVKELIPIRYSRMLASAFAFLRGSAVVMTADLATLPDSGIYVQCCGDCHLMNFGGYATPERNIVFDINDFDETLEAPFEWDVKRLAASMVVAGRYLEFSEKENRKTAMAAVLTYTEKMREFSQMCQLEIWYNKVDEALIVEMFHSDKELAKRIHLATEQAKHRTHEFVFPRISELQNGKRRIIDDPPLIFHPADDNRLMNFGMLFFREYYNSVTDDKKALLSRYKLEDIALKVVGVGSVGTRCGIGLFTVSDEDALILQFKEGKASVLEKYVGASPYQNHGERIVNGQRLMQTFSDIFLGWTKTDAGNDFYVRQLRDMKSSARIETFTPRLLQQYGSMCGWALAKSHAKAGMSPEITGYIGTSSAFAEAITSFAVQYANQTESDFRLLRAAEKSNRIPVDNETRPNA